ncbi:MAG: flippase [Elusimicrobiota bacterium]|jgi:O-antigen/teichoic acid export membrane protein
MRNFTSKLIGEGGVRVFSALFIFLLARTLGAAAFGFYSTAFAFASLFLIVVDLGLNSIVTREIARHAPERTAILRSANTIKFSAALLAIVCVHFLSGGYPFARTHRLLVDTVAIMVVTYSLIDYMGAALAGKEEMGWEACLRTLCRMIVATCGILVLYRTRSLIHVTLSMSIASVFSLGLGMVILRARFGGFPLGWDSVMARRLFSSSLPLLGSVVFWILYDNQDILLLNHYHVAAKDIGLYVSATKIIDVLKVAPVLLAGAFFPALSRYAHEHESFLNNTRALLAYAILLLFVIAGSAFLAAPFLETLLYGPQFSEATPLLRILLVAFAAVFLNHLCLQLLIAKDCERQLLLGTVIACVSKLLFNIWLIPRYGTHGACYSLVASAFIYLAFQARILTQAVPGLLLDPLTLLNPWSLIREDSKGIIKRFREGGGAP